MTLFFDVRNLLEPDRHHGIRLPAPEPYHGAAAGHDNALIGLVKPPAVPVANLGLEQID